MIKDREQKEKALRFSLSQGWFPQLEVEVGAEAAIGKFSAMTDLDIFASIPDQFRGFRTVVFDCKTKARESAINRALWVTGVMRRMDAEEGFCILKKGSSIVTDHRLTAGKFRVILLSEDEFDLYAKVVPGRFTSELSHSGQMELWDDAQSLADRFPKLRDGMVYVRTSYWMVDDPTEACRRTIAALRGLSGELDPSKAQHMCLFLDLCALFARSLALVIGVLFKEYLQPASAEALSEALLVTLYGGREAYQHRNELARLVRSRGTDVSPPDLTLPEWPRFLKLARQLLDAPIATQHVPLILREVGFGSLRGDKDLLFAKSLCVDSPQAARFAPLITDYLARAARLPAEFREQADNSLLSIQPIK